MLRHDMHISRLMVYAQQIEESKLCEVTRDGKRPILDESSQPRSKKGSIFKIFPWETSIGFKTKILKEAKGKEVNQAPHGGSYPIARNSNHFYVLRAKEANPE
ncbi:hypothetical protein EJD97_012236 [Solanum chilense]|uniref:Uncharacterized protein n=1 Tax=Solanum chilense TaxID=4083 RepID=A0A6N2BEA2_SOLCI|nr:hypothetical protein EJD97_012236 [Solanum chilense]